MSSGATTTSNKAISYSGDEEESGNSFSSVSGSSFAPGTGATPARESSTMLSPGLYGGSGGARISDYLGI